METISVLYTAGKPVSPLIKKEGTHVKLSGVVSNVITKNGYTICAIKSTKLKFSRARPIIHGDEITVHTSNRKNKYGEYIIEHIEDFYRPYTKTQITNYFKQMPDLTNIIGQLDMKLIIKLLKSGRIELVKKYICIDDIDIRTKIYEHLAELYKKEQFMIIYQKVCSFLKEYGAKLTEQQTKSLVYTIEKNKSKCEKILEIFEKNPYSLITDTSILKPTVTNFHLVDIIAACGPCKCDSRDERRLLGGLNVAFEILVQNRDTYVGAEKLCTEACVLLKLDKTHEIMVKMARIINNKQYFCYEKVEPARVQTKRLYECENNIATKLYKISRNESHIVDLDMLDNIIEQNKLCLDNGQYDATIDAIRNPLTIITGYPGTGKSKIISIICQYFSATGEKIVVCTPTHLSLKNLQKHVTSKDVDFATLHKFLFMLSQLGNKLKNIIEDNTVVIMDEVSMIDTVMLSDLLDVMSHRIKLILVGDANQLPSISYGAVLSNLIDAGPIPVHKLETIFRQKSKIISENAKEIVYGNVNFEIGDAFKIIPTACDKATIETLVQIIGTMDKKILENTYVITPYSSPKQVLNYNAINIVIKKYFNPDANGMYSVGDRVVCISNELPELTNGDICYISEYTNERIVIKIDGRSFVVYDSTVRVQKPGKKTAKKLAENKSTIKTDEPVKMKPMIDVREEFAEHFRHAYCITLHKSQGSGFNTVIILIPQYYNPQFIDQRFLYTAVTRAIDKIIIIGGKMDNAVKNRNERKTLLADKVVRTFPSA